jgi:protoheme IX farnesyltransferase
MSARATALPRRGRLAAYVELTKPDVSVLVLITTVAGYWMGSAAPVALGGMVHALVGTLLVAAGTAALNHYFERASDAVMRRTARRPLVLGTIAPAEALAFGLLLAVGGTLYLVLLANPLAGALGGLTCASYLGLYTPLKTRSTWATFVGSFPGAAPPLIGWAAAAGSLDVGAWVLFAILFCWQFPHFLSIAWMYREDYARAGIRMLPAVEPSGRGTWRQIVGFAAALVPLGAAPAVVGMAGNIYLAGALAVNVALAAFAWRAAQRRTNAQAKVLMHATVVHIAVLYALLMLDKL